MSNYLKKSLFLLIVLTAPCINLPLEAMYEDLIKDEINARSHLARYKSGCRPHYPRSHCVSKDYCPLHDGPDHREAMARVQTIEKNLIPYKSQQIDEEKLRKLKIQIAEKKLEKKLKQKK